MPIVLTTADRGVPLSATFANGYGEASFDSLTWTSSDHSILVIDSGKVSATGTVGHAKLIVEAVADGQVRFVGALDIDVIDSTAIDANLQGHLPGATSIFRIADKTLASHHMQESS